MKIPANQVELKLNGTQQILVYVDYVNTTKFCKEQCLNFISH